ncbi:MAG: NADH-quinone oxidoreductase subunit M [Leptospiraceae bacterium]|nr:NADH-quinone oxidoreductase subunit M [Leptospiraceae bacterium]
MVTATILIPMATGLLVLLWPRRIRWNPAYLALAGTVATFVAAVAVQKHFAPGYGEAQLREFWFSFGVGINFTFALDGASMPLFLSTAFLFTIAALLSLNTERVQQKNLPLSFWGLLMLLEATVLAIFAAWNFVVFFIFWELFLIPATLLIWWHGLKERQRAALFFFLYTFLSSVFLLLAFAAIIYYTPRIGADFDLRTTFAPETTTMAPDKQKLVVLFLLVAFFTKMPLLPFHAWLPLTHTQAPLGSILLSGLLLKLGSYGILRFVVPHFPGMIDYWSAYLIALALISMIYGALVAYRQQSFRYVIAYSSLAHMGLLAASLFTHKEQALAGAIVQNVGHSLTNALLFTLVVMHLVRGKEDTFGKMAAPQSPFYQVALAVAVFSAIGVPGTVGFTGEFLMLIGLSYYSWFFTAIAVLALVVGAIYMLRLYHKIRALPEENWRPTWLENSCLALLVAAILWFGIYPGFLGENATSTAKSLVVNVGAGH